MILWSSVWLLLRRKMWHEQPPVRICMHWSHGAEPQVIKVPTPPYTWKESKAGLKDRMNHDYWPRSSKDTQLWPAEDKPKAKTVSPGTAPGLETQVLQPLHLPASGFLFSPSGPALPSGPKPVRVQNTHPLSPLGQGSAPVLQQAMKRMTEG